MSMADSIRGKLERAFHPVHFALENESHLHGAGLPGETHFKLVLVSPKFEGLSRVDRQREVAALLDDERARGLHALTMRVMTPAEWDRVKDSFEMESPACRGGSKHREGN